MVETADATAVAATEAATAEEVKEVAETWAATEATVDWAKAEGKEEESGEGAESQAGPDRV